MAVARRKPTHRADGAPVYFRGFRGLNAAPKLAAATGGAVVAAGLSMAGAGTAIAHQGVWDEVAQCESGGNWSINTGNGYHGGLQFSASTWRAFGGSEYASTADQASKAEQIAIAQRTLHGQGPGAWPTCGKRAGLTKANGGADPNAQPGGGSSSDSGGSSGGQNSGALVVDGRFGPATTRALQEWIGVDADGSLSTSDIKALQNKVGAVPDGKIGSETTGKLRQAIGLSHNGVWDFRTSYATVKALQEHLNAN